MLSAVYSDIHRQRLAGQVAAALERVKQAPPQSDEDAFEAVVCLFLAGDIDNSVYVCESRAWTLPWARETAQSLIALFAQNNLPAALARARTVLQAPDGCPDAEAFCLMVLQASHHLEEALRHVRKHDIPPVGETFLLAMMAEVCTTAKDFLRAYRLACAVLATDAENYRALMVLSHANFAFKNYHESLGNALCANNIDKGAPPVTLQIMRCQNMLGDYYATVAAYDAMATAAATAAPLPDIDIELGAAYAGLGRSDQAIIAYRRAASITPPPLEAVRALLMIYLQSRDEAALQAFTNEFGQVIAGDIECVRFQAVERLRRGELDTAERLFRQCHDANVQKGSAFGQLPWPIPEPRLRHDYEQLELLSRRGKLSLKGQEALKVLRPYIAQSPGPQQFYAPEGAAGDTLRRALCEVHHYPDASFRGEALGANDYTAIEGEYASQKLVVIDHFLSQEALAELRRFCEEATIWKMYDPGGYVGALMISGFGSGVLLAIADQLRRAMPNVIKDYPLLQAWGFKYDQRMRGIAMHADFAKVNVNFWVTPDAACTDPTRGGMVVYNHPVPKDWTFADYNSNPEKLQAYLKVHNAQSQRVPYRENRCVLFDSSLIHVTDELHFKPGYENRRINVTLLFGLARSND